jgi:hypothetical protein
MSDLGEVLKFHWNQVDFQQTAGHYWKDIVGRHKKFESRKFVKFERNLHVKLTKNILFWFALEIFHNFINYKLFSSDWSVFSRSLDCFFIGNFFNIKSISIVNVYRTVTLNQFCVYLLTWNQTQTSKEICNQLGRWGETK